MKKNKDLEYLAGFFDGEGCINLQKTNKLSKTYRMRVFVAQLDTRPLYKFKEIFNDGFIYKWVNNAGHIQYQWEIHGKKSVNVLKALLPYLIVKKEQAKLAVKWFELPWRINSKSINPHARKKYPNIYQEEYLIYQKMKDLKKVNLIN